MSDEGIATSAPNELVVAACSGDADAFCQLIEPLQARMLRQAVALAGDLGVAEDLLSETFIEAWKCLPRYDRQCRLSTWLYSILLHRHKKWLRRMRSRPLALAWLPVWLTGELESRHESLPSSDLSPAESVAQDEFHRALRNCVARLPEKHRQIILLRFFEDASLPDMAKVLDCSIGTVKSRLHHALEKLRQMKLNLPPMKGDELV